MSPGGLRLLRSYEIVNAEELPGRLVVLYPAVCSGGKSYAQATNVDLAGRELRDYEVFLPGVFVDVSRDCHESEIYVVDVTEWTVTPIDPMHGHPYDERRVTCVELDAIGYKGRVGFFAGDPRVHRTGYRPDASTWIPDDGSGLAGSRDRLRIVEEGGRYTIKGVSVTHLYRDGREETRPYTRKDRPPATGHGVMPPPKPVVPPAPPRSVDALESIADVEALEPESLPLERPAGLPWIIGGSIVVGVLALWGALRARARA
ncbi:MAG: hypothetical protein R3B09_26145 [Nannocystaceae bacterium]